MSILLAIILPIAVLVFIFELSGRLAYGPYKSESKLVSEWLDSGVKINSLDKTMMMKFPDSHNIDYVSKTPLSVFGSWHVITHGYKDGFRVFRWSKLHKELEDTYQQLRSNGIFI